MPQILMKQKIELLLDLSKKDKTVSQKERELVAYHEAGHTIVGLVLSNARVVHKVLSYHVDVQAVI